MDAKVALRALSASIFIISYLELHCMYPISFRDYTVDPLSVFSFWNDPTWWTFIC